MGLPVLYRRTFWAPPHHAFCLQWSLPLMPPTLIFLFILLISNISQQVFPEHRWAYPGPVTEKHAKVFEGLSLENIMGWGEEDQTKLKLVNKFMSSKVKNWRQPEVLQDQGELKAPELGP